MRTSTIRIRTNRFPIRAMRLLDDAMRFHFDAISVQKTVVRFRIPVGSLLRAAPGAFARQCADLAAGTGSLDRQCGDLGAQTGPVNPQCGDLAAQTGSFARESGDLAAQTGLVDPECGDLATQIRPIDPECARSMRKTVWIVQRTARLNAATARVFLVRGSFGSQSKMARDPIGSAVARADPYGDTDAALQPADGGGVRPVGASLRSFL